MRGYSRVVLAILSLQIVAAVKVKVVMHSEQEDSKLEEDEPRTEPWPKKSSADVTMMPFWKSSRKHVEEKIEYEEEPKTTAKPRQLHPNEMIFPLIYKQNHINSMFKFGENWYTWSTEKRTDGSKATNYFICFDEPKHCDEIGWERTDAPPKCAFQIDSLMPDDRACTNTFGVEPHNNGVCDGGEQMKITDIVRSCGPRIRSLWRFTRVGRRPANAAKPADVNSLVCEDEEECYITVEYRIHHDRITFSLHEPSRGQTFKSALKRDIPSEDENKVMTTATEASRPRVIRKHKKPKEEVIKKKFHVRPKVKATEGKGPIKERNDSGYARRQIKNKIKIREDVSEDISE
ncbi:uncharacterized protein LOC128683210 [Plodia interpunctella]|uniref:uncharacterized protein LOC128683210 n=1 Tax=Plodia interpunctella TaxID=58824 RepID=UPI0023686DD9|nr:uncharacterized protein LOC128683210 [Plodia interpunctella]